MSNPIEKLQAVERELRDDLRGAFPYERHDWADRIASVVAEMQTPAAAPGVPEGWRDMMSLLIQHGRDAEVRCSGMKCREPNCASCYGEEDAAAYVQGARDVYARAAAMLAAAPEAPAPQTDVLLLTAEDAAELFGDGLIKWIDKNREKIRAVATGRVVCVHAVPDDRAAFEAEFSKRCFPMTKWKDSGDYVTESTAHAWAGWKARAAMFKVQP